MAEKRAEVARWQRWIILIEGEKFVFRMGDLTASDVRELRKQSGMGIPEMVAQAELSPGTSMWDIDSSAALIWMARRQAGERDLKFDEVADTLRLDQVIEIRHEDTPEPAEEFPDPPDSGGSSDDDSLS